MYSKQATKVHQIELTSHCNLACKYCPHPKLMRPKQHMNIVTYTEIMVNWIEYFMEQGTQGELSLTGLGEPLMHPDFAYMVALARERIGDNKLIIATNGIFLTEEICRAIKPYNPLLYISLHRMEKAGPAIELAKKYGILESINAQFAYNAINWAGQVDWPNSAMPSPCKDLAQGKISFLSNGDIVTCCMDAHGKHALGDTFLSYTPKAFSTCDTPLCNNCHHIVPEMEKECAA